MASAMTMDKIFVKFTTQDGIKQLIGVLLGHLRNVG